MLCQFYFSFKDGKKISETDQRMQIIREHSDRGFYELVIPEVKKSDAGVYKCVATNKFGESSSEATVTVTGKFKLAKNILYTYYNFIRYKNECFFCFIYNIFYLFW